MVLQHKSKSSLLDLLKSHAGGNVLEKAVQTKPPTPFSGQVPQVNPLDKRGYPSKEVEPQKGGPKQLKRGGVTARAKS